MDAVENLGEMVAVRVERTDLGRGELTAVVKVVGLEGVEEQRFDFSFVGEYREPMVYSPLAAWLDRNTPPLPEVLTAESANAWGEALTEEESRNTWDAYRAQEIFLGDVAHRTEGLIASVRERVGDDPSDIALALVGAEWVKR